MDTPPTEGRAVTTAEAVAEAVVKAMAAERKANAAKRKPKLAVVDGNGARDEDGEPLPVPLSDAALGEYWVSTYGSDWRYVEPWHTWLQWQGDTWQEDKRLRCKFLAVTVVRAAAHWPEAVTLTMEQKRKLSSMGKAGSCLAAAQCNPAITAATDQWDTDPWLLGVPGGVVDLRTGEMHEGRREDYIRMRAAVAPSDDGDPPVMLRFLEQVQPDPEVRGYLKRLIGYGITGLTREQIFSFWQGPGGNGKGTFLRAIMGLLGQYAANADIATFAERPLQAHTQELARLDGARLVVAEETDSNMRWAEGRIKKVTGEGNLTARRMRENDYEFTPRFLLVFVGQHIPNLSQVNQAMKRRLHLVPWSVKIEGDAVDMGLDDKLKAEWPQILRWAINGCLEWQRDGLKPPPAVLAAGAAYFEDQDFLSQFVDECLDVDPRSKLCYADLNRAYAKWADSSSQPVLGQRALVDALAQKGYERIKSHGGRFLRGLKLKPVEERYPGAEEQGGREWD